MLGKGTRYVRKEEVMGRLSQQADDYAVGADEVIVIFPSNSANRPNEAV
jgi:hypothetical protein